MKKIAVIGSLNLDLIATAHHIPAVGETVLAEYGGQHQGGKGANQASAIAKLGGDVVMLGAVGDDASGRHLLRGLKESGAVADHIKITPDEPTGQAWITIDKDGGNTIVVLPGANLLVDIAYIESKRAIIGSVDIVVMQLEIPLETVCYTAKMAKDLGKLVILDPAPAVKDLPDSLLANTDYVKPNESELEILTGYPASRYKEGARHLLERGAKNVIVTLGASGVYFHSKDGTIFEKPAKKVRAVDTTAAGDSFIAAVALGIARGQTTSDAIDFAQAVASIVVTRPGAQSSIPTASEVESLTKI